MYKLYTYIHIPNHSVSLDTNIVEHHGHF